MTSTDRPTGRRLLRLYPRWWQDRYGDEMASLLEARPLRRRARVDLVRGAFDAHLRGAEPGTASRLAIFAALVAGAAWTIVGVASVGGPTPPDWPGYLAATLPIAVVGAVAVLVASLGVARLAWPSSGASVEVAVMATVVGDLAWIAALLVASLGGPYGAITSIAQSLAAIATIGLGLVLMRAGARPVGEAVIVAGAVLLVPAPAAWLVAGAMWTAIGLWLFAAARPDDSPRVLPG